ncbi:MAG: DUF3443 family protein [Candidatus Korobacteraceae bacterium]
MRKVGFLLLLGNVMWFAACGSGGGASNTVTSISVTCSPSSVGPGGTSQCSAFVSGTGNFSSGVTWSASAGSISTSGLLTAPSSPQTVTVTATSTQNTSVSGTANVSVTTTSSNVAPMIVDAGPAPSSFTSVNVAFVTVTVCVAGTTTCQSIDHVEVDTGSEGLRLLSSASGGELNISLAPETVGGNPVDECLVFADGYVWGPVATADVTVAGESASNVPVQLMIPASSSPGVPNSCSSQNPLGGNGNEGGSVMAFGANGIIGVGAFVNDCGAYCVSNGASCNGSSSLPCVYYQCPSSGCTATNLALSQQVPNPVTLFATDNNGVLVQLPAVPDGGSPTVSGSLIFGIGTESNNAVPSGANIYPIPGSSCNCNLEGDIITTFNGQSYPQSFIDSGSNGLFFLDSSVSGVPATCTGQNSSWYCPSNSPDDLTASNQGQTNSGPVATPIPVNFTIENANNLFNTINTAFSTLGGPIAANCGSGSNPACAFDWGLPFFYGKPYGVFTAIDTMSTPAGTGPYFAY